MRACTLHGGEHLETGAMHAQNEDIGKNHPGNGTASVDSAVVYDSSCHTSQGEALIMSPGEAAGTCDFLFFLVWYPQASIPSTTDTHTGADAVLGKPEGSPARRHSRNSCHMFVYIVVCACSRHQLDFKMLLFRSFVSRKGYCMIISRRSESILLR